MPTAAFQSRNRVLVVDDDEAIARLVATSLQRAGFGADWVSDAQAAVELATTRTYGLFVLDYQLPGLTGLELARDLEQVQRHKVPVVVMTAHGHLDAAIKALRAGAADFLLKPFDLKLLHAVVTRVTAHHLTQLELEALRRDVTQTREQHGLLGQHPSMQRLRQQVERLARADHALLITGESGTGKELVARTVHARSSRARGPLVAVNCGALPAGLVESELFGHVRGAFTSANEARPGLFREAHRGTLFLDEVGELPLPQQATLLRALQERRVRPVGANREVPVDVRVIAATNRDLLEAVERRQFRRDLLFRLDVLRLELPPLRERGDDVLLLARHALLRACAQHQKTLTGWSPEVNDLLLSHGWPGNVRELENAIGTAVLACDGARLEVFHFGRSLSVRELEQAHWPLVTLAELERRHIARVLKSVDDNKVRAAKVLGIDRVTLHRKLKRQRP